MKKKTDKWQLFFQLAIFCTIFCTLTTAFAAPQDSQLDISARIEKLIKQYNAIDKKNAPMLLKAPQKMKMQPISVHKVGLGGTLLFSDSPETVMEDGILYRDNVKGKTRLYYYHVNGTTDNKKVVAVIKNPNQMPITVSVSASALSGPSSDYLAVGKKSQELYFGYQQPYTLNLAPGQSCLLDDKANRLALGKDDLMCGIYDFYAPQPVKVSVAIMPMDQDPLAFVEKAPVLPPDEHYLRGTFDNMDCKIVVDSVFDSDKGQTGYLTLADGILDPYLVGLDATTGRLATNYGNYGVLYKLDLPTSGKGNVHYYLQPLGGVYAGAMGVRVNDSPNLDVIDTPLGQLFFGADVNVNEYADLGTYRAQEKVIFNFSPPGASNLPVNIILYPEVSSELD